jgi:hypothetical protein
MSNTTIFLKKLSTVIDVQLNLSENGFSKAKLDISGCRTLFVREVLSGRSEVLYINHGISRTKEVKLFLHPSYVSFNNVNQILSILTKKTDINHYGGMIHPTVFNHPIYNKKVEIPHKIAEEIIAIEGEILEEKLQSVLFLIKDYILEYLFPFFIQIDSIQTINDEIINKIPHMEVSNYIDGANAPWIKLIIMKLCNNPGYGEYTNWLEETFERLLPTNPSMYEPKFQIFRELKELLDSGKYQELIQ